MILNKQTKKQQQQLIQVDVEKNSNSLYSEDWKQTVQDNIKHELNTGLKDIMSNVDNNTLVILNIIKRLVLFS